ncbi:oligo-beta-mannoside permease IIC protein, partial [Klebsiella pneumoniae]|nr:oligo-beta-mannoside permease IIC protein [Klebsiella pneumoniae]
SLRLSVEASPFCDIISMIASLIGIQMLHVCVSLQCMIISVIFIFILLLSRRHHIKHLCIIYATVSLFNISYQIVFG